MPSWSQKIEARNLTADFCTRNFVGRSGVSRYAATPLIVALSPGHSDITRFRPWSPIAPDRKSFGSRRKNSNFAQTTAPLTFLIRVQAFRDPFDGELSHVQIYMNERPNPLTWDAQLFSYWFSRNLAVLQEQLVNLFNKLRGGHCFGSSRTRRNTGGKIATLNWVTQFLMVVYDGTCSPNVSFRMAWISFGASPCRKRKTWWQSTSRCCWNRARRLTYFLSASVTRKDLKFGIWADPSFQRHYRFRPTTWGIRSG